MKLIEFKTPTELVIAGTVKSNCNTISIINLTSGSTMYVNGAPVAYQGVYTEPGNVGELNTQDYSVSFTPNNGNGQALVIRKIYMDNF